MGDADRVPSLAQVPHSPLAVIAGATVQGRIDPDPVANGKRRYVLTDGRNLAPELVPNDDRVDGRRKLAIDDMDVGAADATGADANDNFVWSGDRFRDIDNPDLPGLVDHDCFHQFPPN
jgi:hypothetical protein